MSFNKVTSAKTGKLIRYTDDRGRPIAIVKGGKLRVTPLGMQYGIEVRNGKLVYWHSGMSAY